MKISYLRSSRQRNTDLSILEFPTEAGQGSPHTASPSPWVIFNEADKDISQSGHVKTGHFDITKQRARIRRGLHPHLAGSISWTDMTMPLMQVL